MLHNARMGLFASAIALSAFVAQGAVFSALANSSKAETKVAAVETPAAPGSGEDAAASAPQIDIEGFRSAKFGMSESDVRKAIKKDFNVSGDGIRTEDNKMERTNILAIPADDVLPGGGKAEISYVFGYESKKLIQVGIVWSQQSDEKMTAEQLFSNANVLRTHFISAGYKPETVALNMPISGGLLMFRGSDVDGQTTLLMLQGAITQAKEESQRVLTPSSLMLFYVADAEKPDVYRIPEGLF